MKFISALLAITMTAHASPGEPGKVAIDFLEKVRMGKIDLEPGGDTALSAHTAEDKKVQIARRLERLARDLGSDPLEVGEVKMDENFAAVLVRKIGGFDPSRMQVISVALVKRGAEWMAAPVPASFENAGTGYAVALQKRLELLENWMLQEQVVDLEKLRKDSAARMRQKIEVKLSAKDLREFTAKQVGERLIAACEQGDLSSLLGLLGGLGAELPDDWAARLKSAERAISAGPAGSRPWRLLTSPEVLRVIVQDGADNEGHLLTIDCLDPAGVESKPPRIEFVQFEIVRQNDGLWQINPPPAFLQEVNDVSEEPDEDTDGDLLDAFPNKWSERHPSTPHPTAELIHQAWITALCDGNLSKVLKLLKVDQDPKTARKVFIKAAQTWWTVHNPSDFRQVMSLSSTSDDSVAAGLFQFFSARDPDRYDVRVMYFEKSTSGWIWTPTPPDETREKLKSWVDTETKRWSGRWQHMLLTDAVVMGKMENLKAPNEDEARKCVNAWLDATRRGDVKSALNQTASLGHQHSAADVLQNLGYEINSVRRSKEAPSVIGFYQGKTLAAVGVKADQGGKPSFPLYLVVQTSQGPRILIEIDLFALGNRGRDFLNRAAFDRLQDGSTVALADELRGLYAVYQEKVASLGIKPSR